MKRLFLLNVTLSAPSQGPGPKLLPLGLFSTAPTNLSMMDVRLAVGPAAFQQYLAFFSKYLRAVRTKDDGGVGMHTVRRFCHQQLQQSCPMSSTAVARPHIQHSGCGLQETAASTGRLLAAQKVCCQQRESMPWQWMPTTCRPAQTLLGSAW